MYYRRNADTKRRSLERRAQSPLKRWRRNPDDLERLEKMAQAREMYRTSPIVSHIAKSLGVHESTARRWVEDLILERKQGQEKFRQRAIELYKIHKSTVKVGEIIGFSQATTWELIKDFLKQRDKQLRIEARELYLENRNISAIVRQLGVSAPTLRKWLDDLIGVDPRIEQAKKLIAEGAVSTKTEIAEQVGASRAAISRWVAKGLLGQVPEHLKSKPTGKRGKGRKYKLFIKGSPVHGKAGGDKCAHPTCNKKATVRGLCMTHFTTIRSYINAGVADEVDLISRNLMLKVSLDPGARMRKYPILLKGSAIRGDFKGNDICLYPDCGKSVSARGLCQTHFIAYHGYLKTGKASQEDLIDRRLLLPSAWGERDPFEDRGELYRQGLTDNQIAEQLGITIAAVTGWRKREKLPSHWARLRKEEKAKKLKQAKALYQSGTTNIKIISEAISVHPSTVRLWLADIIGKPARRDFTQWVEDLIPKKRHLRRRNPDLRRRELERRAQSGDLEAAHQYLQELIRLGEIDLTDYFSVDALNEFYIRDYEILDVNQLSLTTIPILYALLYYDLPDQYSWVRSHVVTALGRLRQESILFEFIVREIPLIREEYDGGRQVINAIRGLPVPLSDYSTQLLRELLHHPLLSTAAVLRFTEDQNPENIPYLYELLQENRDNGASMRIISSIGRSGVGPGRGRNQLAVDILRDFLADTSAYSYARVTAARRLAELTRRLAIPYIEAAMTTMETRYDEAGNRIGWPDYHQHADLKKLLRHINQRYILEREHCYGYCTACEEEDRRDNLCAYAGHGCGICGNARQLWHY